MTVFRKKFILLGMVTGQLVMMTVASPVLAHTDLSQTDSTVVGGWSEETGHFRTAQDLPNQGSISFRSARAANGPIHAGRRENRYPSQTRIEVRAVGWTTWPNTYHYTNAQLWEGWIGNRVAVESGRVYGYGGTVAATPWIGDSEVSFYRARTFFGQ